MATITVFLPEESHGQKSLMGYSPQGYKELMRTETIWCTHTHAHTHIYMKECDSAIKKKEILIHAAICNEPSKHGK